MNHLDFHFDVISPFAYLAFERLPIVLEGLSVEVTYRPLLFAGLLEHWGQTGPAELPPKRAWTYRHVSWLAHRHGIDFAMPERHPFNPLSLLRLALACAPGGGTPNRYVCETVLRHVWRGGAVADDAARLATLEGALQPQRDPRGAQVKAELRAATEQAAADGIFGVPTIVVGGRPFWGLDALDMVVAQLRGDAWFSAERWQAEADRPVGVQRRGPNGNAAG